MKEALILYGLSEKEAQLYLTSLSLGEATANEISSKTSFTRSTTYDLLESLEKKDLVNSYKKEKKLYFTASDPKIFLTKLKDKENKIKEIIPKLNELKEKVEDKEKITLYKGKDGLRDAANEMLFSKEIKVYGGSVNADEIFETYTANFATKRVDKKILLKAIIGKSVPEHMVQKNVKKYTQVKILRGFENHRTVYFLFDSKVLIWNLDDELNAIKIESKSFFESQEIIFGYFWNNAREI